jgi:hypothetical protein
VCRVDFDTLGGVGFVLVSPGCVTARTFVEIEEKSFLRQDRRGIDTVSVLYRLPF